MYQAQAPFDLKDYTVLDMIGEGTTGKVYKAIHNISNTIVALKAISKSCEDAPSIQNEVELIKSMDHPYIALFYELIETSDYYILAQEYADNGNLLDFVNASMGMEEHLARKLFIQLIFALDYLHNVKHIAHRDIKFENILLDRNYDVKLIDFGLSKTYTEKNPMFTTVCGSLAYISPEVLLKQPYTVQSDVWSAGIMLYAMTVGGLPFYDTNTVTLINKITSQEPVFPPKLSPEVTSLLRSLLAKDPKNRITIEDIFQNEWVQKSRDFSIINSLLKERQTYMIMSKTEDRENNVLNTIDGQAINVDPGENLALYRITKRSKMISKFRNAVAAGHFISPASVKKNQPGASGSMAALRGLLKLSTNIVSPQLIRPDSGKKYRLQKPCSVSPITNIQRNRIMMSSGKNDF